MEFYTATRIGAVVGSLAFIQTNQAEFGNALLIRGANISPKHEYRLITFMDNILVMEGACYLKYF